jgi:hypothetical protein
VTNECDSTECVSDASDKALADARAAFKHADPDGTRAAAVFRATFDQLYDGQHTGRYKWEQLYKTEKTHFGTLIEINLRREFDDILSDGVLLDYKVAGHEIDCKYSQRMGGWMLPPESFGELLLVGTANDQDSEWALGIVRARPEYRRSSFNRDGKTSLNELGRANINWLQWGAELPPNVLLEIDADAQDAIFSQRSGQKRLDELFRRVTRKRIGRNTVATVAQQDDYMKRVRANGGSRTTLAKEGYLIVGGDYSAHRKVARFMDVVEPLPGEFVSYRVTRADEQEVRAVQLDGGWWRPAEDNEPCLEPAPSLPKTIADME